MRPSKLFGRTIPYEQVDGELRLKWLIGRRGFTAKGVRNTRITVYDVLEYLAGGMTEDQILDDFPNLTREDIRAVLAFDYLRPRGL